MYPDSWLSEEHRKDLFICSGLRQLVRLDVLRSPVFLGRWGVMQTSSVLLWCYWQSSRRNSLSEHIGQTQNRSIRDASNRCCSIVIGLVNTCLCRPNSQQSSAHPLVRLEQSNAHSQRVTPPMLTCTALTDV